MFVRANYTYVLICSITFKLFVSFLFKCKITSNFWYGTKIKYLIVLISYQKNMRWNDFLSTLEQQKKIGLTIIVGIQYRHLICPTTREQHMWESNSTHTQQIKRTIMCIVHCVFFNRNHRRRSNCSLADFQSFVASILTKTTINRRYFPLYAICSKTFVLSYCHPYKFGYIELL